MADRQVDYLLIGGGLAAGNCARWLRESGADGSILLVGREPDLPYNRPPCSKGYLQDKESRDETLFRPPEWYAEQDIEALTRVSVTKLDLSSRTVTLSNKQEVSFGQALLATGANVRRLSVRVRARGDPLPAHARQQRHDPRGRRRQAGRADRRLVHRQRGGRVADRARQLLHDRDDRAGHAQPRLRRAGGPVLPERLEEHGITVHGDDELERFEGADGRVTHVVTKGGRRLEADAVVIGVGAVPDVMLARSAGLEIGELGGVVVDSRLRTSCRACSRPATSPSTRASCTAARGSGSSTGTSPSTRARRRRSTCSGSDQPHDVVPYFFSDLADWASLEYVGPAAAWDQEVVRGSIDDGEFTLWYLDDGRVVAALTVGRSDDLEHAGRMLASRADVQHRVHELEDLSSDLAAI